MDISIKTNNAVYSVVECDDGIAQDLTDYFTFEAPGARYIIARAKKYERETGKKNKFYKWDGKIHLFSKKTNRLYAGLEERVRQFAEERELSFQAPPKTKNPFTKEEARRFIETLNIPDKFKERYYQIDTFVEAVQNRRMLILSPTSSGKSMMIYFLTRWYLQDETKRVLIIVPSIGLVNQMYTDFVDYGYDESLVYRIMGGMPKNALPQVYISTWQSIYDLPNEYFSQFGTVICDEVHGAEAKSIKGIMEKLTECYHRFGFTGTLKDTLCHRLVLEGLFGSVYQAITTKELIDQGYASDLKIKCLLLKHSAENSKKVSRATYAEELKYIVDNNPRNEFIKNLTISLEGNILVLFRLVEEHGKVLYSLIKNQTNQPVYFISGATPGEEREQIRKIVNNEQNAILIGSVGCISTGINIPNIHNIVFASPYKSRIRVLQSIGRGLRLSDRDLTVYDIADDLSYKKHQNFSLLHFVERVKIYNEEKFDYKVYRIDLKDGELLR